MKLRWEVGSGRTIAHCGHAMVGEIVAGAHRTRWRAWVTVNINVVTGTSRNPELAKAEVDKRFQAFLDLAFLTPRVT